MRKLVDEVVRDLGQETAGRALSWKIADLPMAEGDRSLMKQVFVNLLSNAVKFTGKRALGLIEVASAPGENGGVTYVVRDNGAGFDMEYAGRLFGVFQRLHAREDFEGTGIGLANVRRIINRHGGRIWAESAPGQGATFYFWLP